MANQEIKYDGSHNEMMRLGFVDESGCENNKMRNEYNQYRACIYQKAQQEKSHTLH